MQKVEFKDVAVISFRMILKVLHGSFIKSRSY